MDEKLDLSLPAVPPAPAGERIEPHARGLAGLIAAQESAVVYHRSDRLTAMVIVLNGRVVDAVAETRTEVVKGVDVLDELGDLAIAELQVIGVPSRLARALPVYWRAAGANREIVDALVRPGRRGAVLASSPAHGTGVIVFDERGVVASFVDGEMRDEAIDLILDDPATIIAPRAEPQHGRKPVDLRPTQVEDEPQPAAQVAAAELEPQPEPVPETPQPLATAHEATMPADNPAAADPAPSNPGNSAVPSFGNPPQVPSGGGFPQPPEVNPAPSFGGWSTPGFGENDPTAPAPSPFGSAPVEAQLDGRRQAIVDLLQRELGRHAESVSAPFKTAPTIDALQGAALALATESVRLISPNRMQNLSRQASAIARGEQPAT
ncbi:MAG: nucleoporin [Candidatus Dormibacteraceae bacterium]